MDRFLEGASKIESIQVDRFNILDRFMYPSKVSQTIRLQLGIKIRYCSGIVERWMERFLEGMILLGFRPTLRGDCFASGTLAVTLSGVCASCRQRFADRQSRTVSCTFMRSGGDARLDTHTDVWCSTCFTVSVSCAAHVSITFTFAVA